MGPRYPVFVPTKGRHERPMTIRELEKCGIPYAAVVEPQEEAAYRRVVSSGEILVLPHRDKGLTVTRNWIWDYAQHTLGVPYFWTMDDNISGFYRLTGNVKYRLTSGTFLGVMEDFAERYANLPICGMAYEQFAPRRQKHSPLILNTRVYSNMLIRSNAPYRNRLYFNDDTDLCLQVLKAGECTAQFVAFLVNKTATMKVPGGMTEEYEATNKRLEFAQELWRAHPDVVRIVRRYNRWHHQVDYRPFKNNRLRLKPGVVVPEGVNNYGMVLVDRSKQAASA